MILTTALTVLTTNSYKVIKRTKRRKRRRRTRRVTKETGQSTMATICPIWCTLQMWMSWPLSMIFWTVTPGWCAIRTWIWWSYSSLPIRRIAQIRYTPASMIHISCTQSIGWGTFSRLDTIPASVLQANSNLHLEEMCQCHLTTLQGLCTIIHSSWAGTRPMVLLHSTPHLCHQLGKSLARWCKKHNHLGLKMP